RVPAQRRPLADLAEREAAVDALGDLGEDGGRIPRHADVESCSELGDPVELVGARRLDRATQPLEPALEVHEGAVALEIARAREKEIGPTGGEAAVHRDDDRRLGLLRERADVLVGGRLVPRDDEQADRLHSLALVVAARGPRVGDTAAVRRLGQGERAATLAPGESELLR